MVASARRFVEGVARDAKNARADFRKRGNAGSLLDFNRSIYEAFRQGHVKLSELSVGEIFEATVNHGRELRRLYGHQGDVGASVLLAEAEAVKLSDFAAVMLPALSGETMREYMLHNMLQDQLTTTIQTNLEMERIPGVGGIGDQARVIQEGDPYPRAGIVPDWIDTPPTQKRGFIIGLTKEIIFFDRTNLVVKRATDAAKWMTVNKEKRVLSVVAGVTNNYKYMDTSYNTYLNGGSDPWDNTAGSNAFVDWRNIQAAELLFSNMRDPITNEPILMGPARTILCSPELDLHVRRVTGATEVRHDTNPSAGTTGVITISRNPISNYTVLSSRYFADQIGNTTSWITGNFKESFAYLQNWGITVDQAGASSQLGFENDVVLQTKVSERGVAAVTQPRGVVLSTQ